MEKVYIDARDYLRDMWRLSRAVLDSKWYPDVLLALWRGGAPVGAAMHEYLKCHGVKLRHMPVKCGSYSGIGSAARGNEVIFENADEVFAHLKKGEKVLVVDDVFDSGRTAAAVRAKLEAVGCEARIACVWWKPEANLTDRLPDYYAQKTDRWIVFPHEIEGLTPEEIAVKDPVLAELF